MRTKKDYVDILEEKYGRLTFARVLTAWRTCDELSQAEYARRLGISPQNLNDLEKGRRIPSPTRAAKIAKKLGLPEIVLIQLSLRDGLAKEKFYFDVTLKARKAA